MKKLLISLFFCTSLLACTNSNAQVAFPNMVDCGPPDAILSIIERFEEKPMAQAESFIMRPDGTMMPGTMYFFANTLHQSYTMVVSIEIEENDFMWCIVNAGDDFRPMSPKPTL